MFILVLLFATLIRCQPPNICGGSSTTVFNFDTINTNNEDGYVSLPQPYNNLIIKRINSPYTGYPDNHIPILNCSNPGIVSLGPYYVNSATSVPNVIFTTGEYLSINKVNGGTFAILSLQMKSIFIDQMEVIIKTLRLGVVTSNMTINLSATGPTLINVNQKQFDQLLIGCKNPELATCAHITYDDIALCRI